MTDGAEGRAGADGVESGREGARETADRDADSERTVPLDDPWPSLLGRGASRTAFAGGSDGRPPGRLTPALGSRASLPLRRTVAPSELRRSSEARA